MAAQQKRAAIPDDGILGDGVVDVLLDELLDAVVVERYRGVHAVPAEETAGAGKPVVALAPRVVADDKILGYSVFTTGLSEREVVVLGEVLIQRHVVVEILVTGDAREDEVVHCLAHRQAVGY